MQNNELQKNIQSLDSDYESKSKNLINEIEVIIKNIKNFVNLVVI